MKKPFERTWHLKIDPKSVIKIIEKYRDDFFCPFSKVDSYLNIYKKRECEVQFFNLQHCDYSQDPNPDGQKYIRYLTSVEKKLGNDDNVKFLKDNYEKFCIELNEENFSIPYSDPDIEDLLASLTSIWRFDHSQMDKGLIRRARIVRLPSGGSMPYHRDETASKNLRVICPIITDQFIKNGFRTKDEEAFYNFPATGHFYTFEEHKIEHGVFNGSDIDRYALIFTVTNIDNLKEWDREYYQNQMYWNNWGKV